MTIRIPLDSNGGLQIAGVIVTPEIHAQILAPAMERIAALEASNRCRLDEVLDCHRRIAALESVRPAQIQANPHYDHQVQIDALGRRIAALEARQTAKLTVLPHEQVDPQPALSRADPPPTPDNAGRAAQVGDKQGDEAAVGKLRAWSVGFEYYYDAYFGPDAPFGNQQPTAATLAEVLQAGARLVPLVIMAKDAEIASLREKLAEAQSDAEGRKRFEQWYKETLEERDQKTEECGFYLQDRNRLAGELGLANTLRDNALAERDRLAARVAELEREIADIEHAIPDDDDMRTNAECIAKGFAERDAALAERDSLAIDLRAELGRNAEQRQKQREEYNRALAELAAAKTELHKAHTAAGCVPLDGDVVRDAGESIAACIASIKAQIAASENERKELNTDKQTLMTALECVKADLAAMTERGVGIGLPETTQTITMPPVKPPLPSHGHWLPQGVDFADSPDYPKAGSPAEVAIDYLSNKDLNDINWDHRDELVNNQPVHLILEACEETNAPLADDEAFDGYEPGCTYWRTTGQKVKVTLSIKAEVEHA